MTDHPAEPSLFDWTPPPERAFRSTDPDTSRAAAIERLGSKANDRRTALDEHYRAGERGLTDFELAARMRRQQTSVGKRRGELRDIGLIEDSGERRPAPSGSNAIVWRITSKGREIKQQFDAGHFNDIARTERRGGGADPAHSPTAGERLP